MREQSESDARRYRAGNQAMKLLVIDNYDSFTYNLVQLFGEMEDVDLVVKRNDEISIEEIKTLKPDRICISPGPGRPENAGISSELIRELGPRVPILGALTASPGLSEINRARRPHSGSFCASFSRREVFRQGASRVFRAVRP